MNNFYFRSGNKFFALFDGRNQLGRASTSRIQLRGKTCSRHHATIVIRSDTGVHTILNTSSNNIFVNDRPMERSIQRLHLFDCIRFPSGESFVFLDVIPCENLCKEKVIELE